MNVALKDGRIIISDIGGAYHLLKGVSGLSYQRSSRTMSGAATLSLLDDLSGIGRLPKDIEAERQRMRAVRDAMDAERDNPAPKPLVHYPVKATLYAHQIRAANMALLHFGLVAPPGRREL